MDWKKFSSPVNTVDSNGYVYTCGLTIIMIFFTKAEKLIDRKYSFEQHIPTEFPENHYLNLDRYSWVCKSCLSRLKSSDTYEPHP